MQIVAHRGYWKIKEEKNTQTAFECAFESGFGIETDIRDLKGELVISHDMPKGGEMPLEAFFRLYQSYGKNAPLALNIKADGLQKELKKLIEKYDIENYFCFDMSIPDTVAYINHSLKIFSRSSEYETQLPFYEESTGVWMDCFNSDWFKVNEIQKHVECGKKVCIVSPELHKREYTSVWKLYKKLDTKNILLCTDYPNKAKEYFNGTD